MAKSSGCGWKSGVLEVTSNRDLWKALFAEFVGVMLLIVIGCGSGIPWSHDESRIGGRISGSVCAGMLVAVLVQSTAHVSGGNLNPAVSLALLVAKKMSCLRAVFYVLTQLAGAMLGAAIVRAFCPSEFNENLGVTRLHPMVGDVQGFGVEFFITFTFILIIFAVTDDEVVKTNKHGSPAIIIGFSISAGHFFGLPFTGASMNPARSFGPAMVNNYWDHHWIYWVGPCSGAVAAALMYKFVFDAKLMGITKPLGKDRLLLPDGDRVENDLKSIPV